MEAVGIEGGPGAQGPWGPSMWAWGNPTMKCSGFAPDSSHSSERSTVPGCRGWSCRTGRGTAYRSIAQGSCRIGGCWSPQAVGRGHLSSLSALRRRDHDPHAAGISVAPAGREMFSALSSDRGQQTFASRALTLESGCWWGLFPRPVGPSLRFYIPVTY